MSRSLSSLLCLALVATASAQMRPIEADDGQPGGERPFPGRGMRSPPAQSAAPPAAPVAAPQPSAPMMQPPRGPATQPPPEARSTPTQPPRFGLPPGNAPRNDRPPARPSDPASGHWSTQGMGERRNDGRFDPRVSDPWRTPDPRWQQRDDRERSRVLPPPRSFQWRDYDRFRTQNFRFDGGRYYSRSRYQFGAYLWPRGFGVRLWLIGEWLPSVFFADNRYMLEYWRFGLYPPPAGCRWLRVGNDALLVDDFNGEVLDAVYDLFW